MAGQLQRDGNPRTTHIVDKDHQRNVHAAEYVERLQPLFNGDAGRGPCYWKLVRTGIDLQRPDQRRSLQVLDRVGLQASDPSHITPSPSVIIGLPPGTTCC